MYKYNEEKKYVFTEEGQVHFLFIRDLVHEFLESAGAFQMCKAMKLGPRGAADSFEMMACIDRLVELEEIEEIPRVCAGQFRTFVKKSN